MVLLPVYLRVMRSPAPTLTWMCSLSPRARIPSATSFSRLWRPEYPRWSPTRVGQSSLSGTGRLAFAVSDVREFSAAVERIATDASLLARMRLAARQSAMSVSWDAVFESVYLAYERSLHAAGRPVRLLSVRGRVPARTLAL